MSEVARPTRSPARVPLPLRLLFPAPIDIVFLVILYTAILIRGAVMLAADGDLGRHVRVGSEILQTPGILFATQPDPHYWTKG